MGPGKGRATPGAVGRSCCSRPTAAGTRGRRSGSSAQSRGCLVPRSWRPPPMPGAGRPSPAPPARGSAKGDKRPHVAVHPPDLFRAGYLSAHRDFSRAIVRSMKLSRCLSVSTVVFGLIFAGCAGVKPMQSTGTGGSGNGSGTGKGGSNGTGGRITVDAGSVDLGDPTLCGNSTLDPGEKCDDGNKLGGDGCTPLCQIEKGWICPTVGQLCMRNDICGDGILTAPEACDDGNTERRRRLLGRLPEGRHRLALPRPGQALHPDLRRRRHRRQREVRRRQHDQRRRLLQHLPGRARVDLPDDRPALRWPGSAPPPSAATA